MLKKIVSVLLSALMLFSLTACSGGVKNAFECEGVSISQGLYAYYLSLVSSSPEDYGASSEDRDSIISAARECCKQYVAAIKLMEKKGITLSNELKREAAQNTQDVWSLFSDYYESLGVTKQDITKVQTHECRKLCLLDYYYGTNGTSPVSQSDLKEKFVELYVGFKVIVGSLTKETAKGETASLSQSEQDEIEKLFESMASQINSGTATIDELNESYNESLGIIVTGSLSTEILKQGDPMYDDSFFTEVMSITHGKAKMIKSGSSIYVVQRQTIATEESDAFELYRTEVLKEMKMSSVEKKLSSVAQDIVLEENGRTAKKQEKNLLGK